MKGSYKFGIGLVVIAIILIAVIQASQQEPVNWSKTYNPKDKIPFGTYVVRQELKTIFPGNRQIKAVNQSIYSYLTDSAKNIQGSDLLYIGNAFDIGKAGVEKLLEFVKRGNNAMICATDFGKVLADTLHLSFTNFDAYNAGVSYNPDSFYYKLAATGQAERFEKNSYPAFFDSLKNPSITILGYLIRGKIQLPNFIRLRYGKGNFYFQLTPDIYSNYFMLKDSTFPIAYTSLHYLNGNQILWYDGQYDADTPQTPLRFILSQPALRLGWYLLLITLALFLVFKSKREQAAIPIVKPEENLSVAFAETIGSLYYENGHPGNMISKKINYFLYNLKRDFRLNESDFESPQFYREAAARFHLPEAKIQLFFSQLKAYQSIHQPETNDLKKVQELIENFKQKIKKQ